MCRSGEAHGRKSLPGRGISGQHARREGHENAAATRALSSAPLLAPLGSPRAQKRSLDSGPSGLFFPVVKRRLSVKRRPAMSVCLEGEAVASAFESAGATNDAVSLGPASIVPLFQAIEMEDFLPAAPDVPQTRDADADGIKKAVESALQSFDEAFETFALDCEEDYRASAQQSLQNRVHEQYEKLCSAFVGLMDETGHDALPEVQLDDVAYDVIRFCGAGGSSVSLLDFDASGPCGAECSKTEIRAREEVCGLLPILASRAEKSWFSTCALDQAPAQRRRAGLHDNAMDASHSIRLCAALRGKRGSSAYAFECPTSTFRIGVIRNGPSPLPASLVLTQHLPLSEALARLDALGSLREMRTLESFEFALQERAPGEPAVDRQERKRAHDLYPEAALKDLLCSDSPVVMVDVATVLAPRERSSEQALCEVVESELLSLLREAKMRGRAVVFALSDDRRAEACEELLQTPPLATYGLRCGYFRWRNCLDLSCAGGWACDQSAERRTLIGLQLP